MSERADRDLVELARRGDGAAVGELFSRYWRAARAAAFGVTGEFASAEDAAAEAFRQALAGLNSLRDPNHFGSWLRTIVVRKARLESQQRRPTADALVEALPSQDERPDDALERLELAALIQQAVRELPGRLREAMALVYFEGYDSDAAARFLDIPAGTLRRRLHDGRRQLRSAVDQILQGDKRLKEERERQVQRIKNSIDKGEIYQGLRECLALRPPPKELVGMFLRRQVVLANESQAADGGNECGKLLRETAHRFSRPSDRASDTNHPVGSIAAAIRKALPGFAEGRPGAFLRASRAILHLSESGPVRSIYQLLQDSPDEETFRAASNGMRISDVLDLTWMVAGPLELRSVQELLDRLISTVLPGKPVRFSTYDEPRYRSALQLQVGGFPARAAHGGVLREWPGCPRGVNVAHLRIFLEPWATVRSGQAAEFDRLPERPRSVGSLP